LGRRWDNHEGREEVSEKSPLLLISVVDEVALSEACKGDRKVWTVDRRRVEG
tara:strand:- start:1139 stop:1294 length:156 start_codon:yes stop_codon:yes gene_type:complete